MYVTTFYSFKGGVGRSMALVNVGVELARRGRRVLLVDFDLEAPGLDTFTGLGPIGTRPGLLDYVTEYRRTGRAPEIASFVYRSTIATPDAGGLWLMPAGTQDPGYGARLHHIDWPDLYARHDGYLLFENLRAQWAAHLRPDYVLIDSRTGHTDVGGICTRQLPDSVVILFFPNEQNLQGLRRVVSDIRGEESRGTRGPVELHFVTANVPDLDDEHQILSDTLRRFQQELGYTRAARVIYHYPSLSLVNQSIFTLDRPTSRLAREYATVVNDIVRHNTGDRDGALAALRDAVSSPRQVSSDARSKIHDQHSTDGEVLYWLARVYEAEGNWPQSLELLAEAEQQGWGNSELFGRRAKLYMLTNDNDKAVEAARAVLAADTATLVDLRTATQLMRSQPDTLVDISASRAILALPIAERCELAESLLTRESKAAAWQLAEALLADTEDLRKIPHQSVNSLALCLISAGRFADAKKLLAPGSPPPEALDRFFAFNFAMADWGATGTAPQAFFARVLELDRTEPPEVRSANYEQCLAIASWAVGDHDSAGRFLDDAIQRRGVLRGFQFSSWSYLILAPREFREDLLAIRRMINGERIQPAFISDHRQLLLTP